MTMNLNSFAASSMLIALILGTAATNGFVPSALSSPRSHIRRSAIATSLAASSDNDDGPAAPSFVDNALTIASSLGSLRGKTIVVKYGGNAMTTPELAALFCEDVAALQGLGVRVVVVHGGGPMINAMLERVGVESRFEGGMRVSTPAVVDVAAMVLCGTVNKDIAGGVVRAGGRALGLSGRDDGLLRCEKLWGGADGALDLGNVGQVVAVNTALLEGLLDDGITPVVAPIGTGRAGAADEGTVYNINADVAAGRIAGELGAARVLFLTDIAGVLDKEMALLERLSCDDIDRLIDDETITGGMIPKVTYATDAVKLGVQGAFITDGRVPHALLNEVLAGGAEGLGSGGGGTVVTL